METERTNGRTDIRTAEELTVGGWADRLTDVRADERTYRRTGKRASELSDCTEFRTGSEGLDEYIIEV